MRLSDLGARFIWLREDNIHWQGKLPWPVNIKDALGIIFLCPLCFKKNNGPIGTHSVICWFVGKVPDDAEPKPGRWTPLGTSLEDLTFVLPPPSVSVQLIGGCNWHGFIKNGEAE